MKFERFEANLRRIIEQDMQESPSNVNFLCTKYNAFFSTDFKLKLKMFNNFFI
ncbi:hypothetical protein X767_33065 [Mesorhizobium sp. LSJC264A00]|nr:hypothetical protein X767_33065 [Mesorhizobium sp. LSJC264A00]